MTRQSLLSLGHVSIRRLRAPFRDAVTPAAPGQPLTLGQRDQVTAASRAKLAGGGCRLAGDVAEHGERTLHAVGHCRGTGTHLAASPGHARVPAASARAGTLAVAERI